MLDFSSQGRTNERETQFVLNECFKKIDEYDAKIENSSFKSYKTSYTEMFTHTFISPICLKLLNFNIKDILFTNYHEQIESKAKEIQLLKDEKNELALNLERFRALFEAHAGHHDDILALIGRKLFQL